MENSLSKKFSWQWLINTIFIVSSCFALSVVYLYKKPVNPSASFTPQDKKINPSAPPPIQVEVKRLQSRPFKFVISGSGDALPMRKSKLGAAVSGNIVFVDFYEGQLVKKGQILARVDDSLWKAKKNEMEAECKRLESDFSRLKAGFLPEEIEEKQASVDEIKATLRSLEAELTRKKSLFERDSLSATDWDNARFSYEATKARLKKASAELTNIKNGFRKEDIESMKSQLEKAQAQLAQAVYTLDHAIVRAPFDGFVLEKKVEIGEWMKADSPVATIADLSSVKVEIFVHEKLIPFIDSGVKVEIIVDALPVYEKIVGYVTEVVPQSLGGRNFPIRIQIPNKDYKIKIGMFCRAFAVLREKEDALMVHTDALVRKKDGVLIIKVNKENQAEFVRVVLGERDQDWYEILDSGGQLQPEDQVVVTNNWKLYDKAPVSIIKEYR